MNCKVCNSALEKGQNACSVCGSLISPISNSVINDNSLNPVDNNNLVSNINEPADIFGFDQSQVDDSKVSSTAPDNIEVKEMFGETSNEPIVASPLPASEDLNVFAVPTPNSDPKPEATPIMNNPEPVLNSTVLELNEQNNSQIIETVQTNDNGLLKETINSEPAIEPIVSANITSNSVENNTVLANQVINKQPDIQSKKTNRIFLYIIIVIFMIGAGIGGYYVFLEFGPRQIAQVNKYEYKIDRRYNASINNNFLIIDNKAKTWSIEITSTIDFKSLEEFTTKTTAVYQEVKASNKSYENMKMIVIEVRDSGKVFYTVAAEKKASEFLSAQISFKDNKLDAKAIDVFADIVKTSKKISQKVTTE